MHTNALRALLALILSAAVIAAPSPASGASQRTFVKSNGLDANACSLAAPCRSFATAIGNTLAGGEVIVLDSAGYGPVTISQSVSIIAPPGVYAGISVSAGAGITVSGAGIVVSLQGLSINGTGGTNGISFLTGAELHVSNCSIANMSSVGLFANAVGAMLYLSDTAIRGSGLFGVLLSGTTMATIDRARIENNGSTGIYATNGATMSVRDSLVANNTTGGVEVAATGATLTRATVDDTVLADNDGGGASLNATDTGSLATLDIVRTTNTRNTSGSGLTASATAPALAVATVASSLLSENAAYALFVFGNAVALANGNTVSRNFSGGFNAFAAGVIHTRSNNSGVQSTPVAGTVTPVAGF